MEPDIVTTADQGQHAIQSVGARYMCGIIEAPHVLAAQVRYAAVVPYIAAISYAVRYLVCRTQYFCHLLPGWRTSCEYGQPSTKWLPPQSRGEQHPSLRKN